MQKKSKKRFWLLLKLAVAISAFWFIYLKIKGFNLSDFKFPLFNFHSYSLLSIVILLMPLNWFIETLKWKYLIRKLEDVSLKSAFKAVLSGIAFTIISPNRTGELAGRVFILKKEYRGKAVFATAAGSLSQMLVTLIIGIIFGFFFIFNYSTKLLEINPEQLLYLKIVSLASLIFGLLFFFNLKHFIFLLKKMKINIKFLKYIEILSEYSVKELINILLFSLLRYSVFTFQFILLLYFFNVKIILQEAITSIALTWLLSSLVPVLTILEIGVRGTAAILFLGMFSQNIPGILAAVALLWLINLALPAIFGTFIFYKTKI